MKQFYHILFFMSGFFGTPAILWSQTPVIQFITANSNNIPQYGKLELILDMTAAYTNPYDYQEIHVDAIFTGPDGSQTTVEGFYMEDFEIANTNTGALNALPTKGFRVRFSPKIPGAWTYQISCTNSAGTGAYPVQNFTCESSNLKGFVQAGQSNYLQFENGTPYVPVGENIAWQNSNPYTDYKKWVGKMADNGGNFLRLWLCHWGMGLEWKNDVNGFSGLKKYKQNSAFYLDWLFDYCAEREVYVMFCLNHHGQVSSQVNPNWPENPYNSANGGPCQNTWDFFSNAQAKSLIKNRLRYILARWGYQRSIMTWELFNEVNWTDNYEQHKPVIADWHAEMAAFLKQKDSAQRPVSTSYGSPQSEDPAVWNNPDLDYTQRHYYFDSPNLEAVLSNGVRENLDLYDKPTLIAEFGLNAAGSNLLNLDPNGIHLHNNLWGPLFGGGMGSGMTWWWDSYVEPGNLYDQFLGLSEVSGQIDFVTAQFQPANNVNVSGASGDLKLNTNLDWSGLGDTLIQINANGVILPANYKLSQYLYGSVWNTQYRRPPSFQVDMPQAGQFKILTGNQFGANPKLSVWVDGVQVLSVTPALNQTYMVNIPAGLHTVKVDNIGTDWMKIACYAFMGLGSAIDAYVLASADQTQLSGWVLNSDYNHQYIAANGQPAMLSGASIKSSALNNGNYWVKWFDCQTGALVQAESVLVSNGTLELPIPDLTWDLAFKVDALPVNTQDLNLALSARIYPNPVVSGRSVQVSLNIPSSEMTEIVLFDAAGKRLQSLFNANLTPGPQNISLQIPAGLPIGIYWIHIIAGSKKTSKAIAISAD
jgi:hypothetical protein